ncbi:radical SAM protein [[Eubacterium] cellulosolvens]
MIVKEKSARSILSESKVSDYTVNPYVGCEHRCTYCYARFMKRFTGHRENWGEFIDVKINAPILLKQEIKKKRVGRVWISGICDPYQPIEQKYELTRKCLKILLEHNWPVTIQTKSPIILRDIDLLKKFQDIEAGFTITTADDKIRQIFEPKASTIRERIQALKKLKTAGIQTFAMIAPLLPGAEDLPKLLNGIVDHILLDRMNYHYADWVYTKYNFEYANTDKFFYEKRIELSKSFKKEGITFQILF